MVNEEVWRVCSFYHLINRKKSCGNQTHDHWIMMRVLYRCAITTEIVLWVSGVFFPVVNADETLAVGDNLLFEFAMEEIPASMEAEHMNMFLQRLYDTETGKRIKAGNNQLKKAAKLFGLKGIKRKQLYLEIVWP